MKKKVYIVMVVVLSVLVLYVIFYLKQFTFSNQLSFVSEYSLDTPSSRFDYQAFGDNGLLYLNHMGNDSVIVYDTKTNTIVKEISGIGSPRGIDVSKQYQRAYVTSPDTDEVVVIDTTTNTITKKIKVGADPDGIAVDDDDSRVFLTNESGESVSVIDQNTQTEIKQITLTNSVGNTKYDAIHHKVYSAVHDGTFVVIDPVAMIVEKTIILNNCDTPHGFAVDEALQQALISCQGNNIALVVDLATGKELFRSTVGAGSDVVAFDTADNIGIVSSAAGIASLFQFGSAPTKLGDQFIAANAHTVAINPDTHLVYFSIEFGSSIKVYAL